MSIPTAYAQTKWRRVRLGFDFAVSGVVIVLALMLFIYPAVTISILLLDSQLHKTGESRLVPMWFNSAAERYLSWANTYLETNYAESLYHDDIPATEWPIFGSVFFLVTAEDLQRQGKVDATRGTVRDAVEKAAEIVASPVTATWVKTKWGDGYLEKENVFYRMLLIMGLSSYERITGDERYRALMSTQRATLAEELAKAELHLRDDYPNECYPADMLWAVAAIQRAARLEDTNHDELAASLIAVFDGPLKAPEGLPAFQAESRSGRIVQGARGCANSGLLLFAAELDREVAGQWYRAYEANFWKDTGWVVGFSETPHDWHAPFMDVDSGPVVFGCGSVATAFGIGAAKAVGRYDHAAPLTIETIACSWPTPLGFLIPGLMGRLAVQSWSLGEVAILFSMTRPTCGMERVPFEGSTPRIVWLLLTSYSGLGLFFIWFEIRCCRRLIRRHKGSMGKEEDRSMFSAGVDRSYS
ncbi:MAG: hypothetical protein GXY83_22230 [Rhodopirellula sp.]|nr:hypothetical protein [Rhodopirellula sp.]